MSSAPTEIAIIGFGNHVVKNVMPCFDAMSQINVKAIFVRDVPRYQRDYPDWRDLFSDDLSGLFGIDDIQVIYIATPISTHFEYATQALEAGKHVWLEKPLTSGLDNSKMLADKARAARLFLGEISMYQFHRQFAEMERIISEKISSGERVIGAQARFSIPELDSDNIRYQKELGGGALLDVGYYPLSAMVRLFGTPDAIEANGFLCSKREVDLSGSAMLTYDGFSAHCIWAIGSAYHNEIEISFEKSTIRIPRAFSKPADLETEISIIGNFGQAEEPIKVPGDDQFSNIFMAFCETISSDDPNVYNEFLQLPLRNANILENIFLRICNLP